MEDGTAREKVLTYEGTVRSIRRNARKKYSWEERIRIVLEQLIALKLMKPCRNFTCLHLRSLPFQVNCIARNIKLPDLFRSGS